MLPYSLNSFMLVLKNIVTVDNILGSYFLSLSTWKTVFHCLLILTITVDKLETRLIFTTLRWHFLV